MSSDSEQFKRLIAESESIQNFLRVVYRLQQNTERVSTSAMAQILNISAPSVTDMAQRLGAAGFVDYRKHKGVALTAAGETEALKIIRRHRLIELYLTQELGYAPYEVHSEADKLEHVVSEHFVEAIARKLGDPALDPHGDPIPAADGTIVHRDLTPLSELPENTPAIVERYKSHETNLLRHILERGFELGTHVQVVARDPFDGPVTVLLGQEERVIGYKIATFILVQVQDAPA